MISEPELEGTENGPPPLMPSVPAPRAGDGVQAPPAAGPETIAGRRPPWLPPRSAPWPWALGGAVAASAVWAAGLYAYGPAGPDLGGYGISRNLCRDAELPAIATVLGKRRYPRAAVDEQLAIDRAHCSVTLIAAGRDSGPAAYTGVDVDYSLHKRTDPGPEFDATVTRLAPDGAPERRVMRIPDLGERAYLVTDPSRDEPELKVLDGQAVLTIAVRHVVKYTANPTTGEYEVPEPADFSGIESAMVEDMRDLMDALKK
ncbi:hypothetical protein [Streptomyces lushanensis]|uniref:hypothetical protein n=1 Tax=Streptomyces lushanensis TaxID=1434255 RepID=UPI0008367A9C|nr:hypothetical protein [Streptomyces lushanensis]